MPAPGPTALLDHVDDADEPIGVVARREVFAAHAGFRVVHVFVFNRAGELLLQRVGATGTRSPLQWGSSVAGYLHAGETYAEAARRRLREELGLSAPLRKVGATRMNDHGATKFITLFSAHADHVESFDHEHIDAIAYVSVSEVRRRLDEVPGEFTDTFPHVFRLFQTVAAS